MHKFAVIHKHSGIVCYSSSKEKQCVAPSYLYSIVSTESASNFTIITPDLSFNNYAEIADALNSSDKIVFTTDSDDNLTVSDGSRSVAIPALLFQETILQIEEVVFGDVCEIVEEFGFNVECTELLARNAVKFWTAARFLETTETIEGEEMTETTETTETIKAIAENLEIHDSCEFVGELAFTYQGDEFLLGDFMYTTEHDGWHGVMGLSYFSAYYVRYEKDGSLTLGYAHW